jgi:hypothetical protein
MSANNANVSLGERRSAADAASTEAERSQAQGWTAR